MIAGQSSVLLLALAVQATAPSLAIESFPPAAREAISRVHRAAVANPQDVEAVGALARMLHAWELWEPAHATYERLHQIDPKAFEWRYLDAVVLQRLARHADAAGQLRRALSISPDYLPAQVRLAESLFEAGRLDESEPLFAALVKQPAAEPAAELALGRIAAAADRHDAAVVHLQRAIALFPELGAAHYALALSYRALGRQTTRGVRWRCTASTDHAGPRSKTTSSGG